MVEILVVALAVCFCALFSIYKDKQRYEDYKKYSEMFKRGDEQQAILAKMTQDQLWICLDINQHYHSFVNGKITREELDNRLAWADRRYKEQNRILETI